MTVWIVGISNCESNSIKAVCINKAIAERELFKTRNELIAEWIEADINAQKGIENFCKKENKPIWIENTYKEMITALASDGYERWNNYPHDKPYLYEIEVMEV